MRKAIISIPESKDEAFYLKLFKKMGVKVRFLSDEQIEDVIFGKLIKEGITGESVSEEEVLKTLRQK